MNAADRDNGLIRHMSDYCLQIEATVEHFGDDIDVFNASFIYQNAVAMCLMQIGELAGLLSESYRLIHQEIPWRQIRALRNIIAHNYGSIDKQTAWEIIHQDIPALKEYCEGEASKQ